MSDYYPGAYEGAIVSGATREYRERIKALEAEVERLTTDLATARSATYVQRLAGEAERARREVKRLREALQAIAAYGNDGICPYGCDTPHIARAALAGEGDDSA